MKTEEKLKICIRALKALTIPKGVFSLDRMEHAQNTIRAVSELATEALETIGELKK